MPPHTGTGTMINGELIDLVAGDYEARIATSGAMLVHLRRQGRDLIMPFDAEATLPAGWQGKTLLPWANRIAGARYDYGGTEFLVACNEPASGSALHGLAGWMDWQVVDDDPSGPDDGAPRSQVVLELSLLASYGYPWSLEVSACFRLGAEPEAGADLQAPGVAVGGEQAQLENDLAAWSAVVGAGGVIVDDLPVHPAGQAVKGGAAGRLVAGHEELGTAVVVAGAGDAVGPRQQGLALPARGQRGLGVEGHDEVASLPAQVDEHGA